MDFVAIDFETANEDLASVCQVGIVRFKAGEIAETYSTLVNPQDDFSFMNTDVHGIDEEDVADAPIFSDVYPIISGFLSGSVVVSHTAFDRVVLGKSVERYQLSVISCEWLDTARVVRRAWEKYARSGYGLANVAKDLGITFNHHNAEEDARAAGLILLHVLKKTSIDLDSWKTRVTQPISGAGYTSVERQGNSEGYLYGEVAVFTGALSMPRQKAADLAAAAGCEVDSGVTKKTTLLIVGDQDIKKLRLGEERSTKHRKAEELIAKGQPIRVLQESDFIRIVGL